jgi:hypothetical protein
MYVVDEQRKNLHRDEIYLLMPYNLAWRLERCARTASGMPPSIRSQRISIRDVAIRAALGVAIGSHQARENQRADIPFEAAGVLLRTNRHTATGEQIQVLVPAVNHHMPATPSRCARTHRLGLPIPFDEDRRLLSRIFRPSTVAGLSFRRSSPVSSLAVAADTFNPAAAAEQVGQANVKAYLTDLKARVRSVTVK